MPHSIEYINNAYKFKNVHGNYLEPFIALARVYTDPSKSDFEAYRENNDDIRAVLQEAKTKQMRARACGTIWSLSRIPYVNGMQIFSRNLNDEESLKKRYFLQDTDRQIQAGPREYLFCQCGNLIKDLNDFLKGEGRSLPTSGASNGQTIAGVIGTGVHGSTINFGSLQECVYGLHLITGPEPGDSIFLEPEDTPVANQAFAQKIGATLVRDNDKFYSALVGLGAFGYVHGVLIKTEDKFLLRNFIKKVPIQSVYDFMNNMDIDNTVLNANQQDPNKLFHMKFYINQYDYEDNVRAEIIYKFPGMVRVAPPDFLSYNKDFVLGVGKLFGSLLPFLIPFTINKQLPEDGKQETGSLGEIFKETTNLRDGQFSCAIATDVTNGEELLKLMLAEAAGHRKIPSLFSLRFVKQSKARMAFTRYDMNCLFGIDGIYNKATKKFLRKIADKLIACNIPHTWHWGKFNVMDSAFVSNAFGQDRVTWIQARQVMFSDPVMAQTFTNEYLHSKGLA